MELNGLLLCPCHFRPFVFLDYPQASIIHFFIFAAELEPLDMTVVNVLSVLI